MPVRFYNNSGQRKPYNSNHHLFVPGLEECVQHGDGRFTDQGAMDELPLRPHRTVAVRSVLAFGSLLVLYEPDIPHQES